MRKLRALWKRIAGCSIPDVMITSFLTNSSRILPCTWKMAFVPD